MPRDREVRAAIARWSMSAADGALGLSLRAGSLGARGLATLFRERRGRATGSSERRRFGGTLGAARVRSPLLSSVFRTWAILAVPAQASRKWISPCEPAFVHPAVALRRAERHTSSRHA